MSTVPTDVVKVRLATVEPGDNQIILRLNTVDDVDVFFALDDIAWTALSLTAQPMTRSVLERAQNKTTYVFKEAGDE